MIGVGGHVVCGLLGILAGQAQSTVSETASKTIENKVLVVRHGAAEAQPTQPATPLPAAQAVPKFGGTLRTEPATPAPAAQAARGGQIVRPAPAAPATTGPTPEEIAVLNELADLGLIAIRQARTDDAPAWKYKPKEYHGYHPKPQWTYHDRAGWRYDADGGWRYRREPDFALRPGGVERLLSQMHTRGDTRYVTRWR